MQIKTFLLRSQFVHFLHFQPNTAGSLYVQSILYVIKLNCIETLSKPNSYTAQHGLGHLKANRKIVEFRDKHNKLKM